MENHRVLRPALGSHNVRSLSAGMAAAEELGVPKDGLRGPGPPRDGRADRAGLGRRGGPLPGVYALRGDAPRDGVPRPPIARKHVQRVVPEGELRQEGRLDALLRNPEETGAMFGRRRRPRPGRTRRRTAAVSERADDGLHGPRIARRCARPSRRPAAGSERTRPDEPRSATRIGPEAEPVATAPPDRPGRIVAGPRAWHRCECVAGRGGGRVGPIGASAWARTPVKERARGARLRPQIHAKTPIRPRGRRGFRVWQALARGRRATWPRRSISASSTPAR